MDEAAEEVVGRVEGATNEAGADGAFNVEAGPFCDSGCGLVEELGGEGAWVVEFVEFVGNGVLAVAIAEVCDL